MALASLGMITLAQGWENATAQLLDDLNFINTYKTPLLWLSIVMNLAGVADLLWKIQQQRRMVCHTPTTFKENIAYGND